MSKLFTAAALGAEPAPAASTPSIRSALWAAPGSSDLPYGTPEGGRRYVTG
jgi:hypothetical protein